MLNETIKRIEEEAIASLQMHEELKPTGETKEEIKEYLIDIFEANNTGLSEVTLNRMVRFVSNLISTADMKRQLGADTLLLALRKIGMQKLVEEYKRFVKLNA